MALQADATGVRERVGEGGRRVARGDGRLGGGGGGGGAGNLRLDAAVRDQP